jgi:formylglycine-generating enzyme required for sulfatase activity
VVRTSARGWSPENYLLQVGDGELTGKLIAAGGDYAVTFLRDDVSETREKQKSANEQRAKREEKAALERAQEELKKRFFRDCPDCPEMVMIPAGSFEMGSPSGESGRSNDEGPVHRVSLERFAIGKTEVTQGQWGAVMGNNPSQFSSCGDDCPVEKVSWEDAQEFARKLSAKTGKTYRLPSEAQWEYACRAGGRTLYCGSDNLDAVAWHGGNSGGRTHSAGLKQANAFGLVDMSGNVWEWVEDCSHNSYNGAPSDGSAWTNGSCDGRVLRGGSWSNDPRYARAARRSFSSPGLRDYSLGFRLTRMLP